MQLEPVIGLEIHVQLKTKSKMFCGCDNGGENQPPNTAICPVCMGHPGTLPVANAEAVKMGIKTALALNLRVNNHFKFDRKNYFYPDLPKGYQISQYDEPLAQDGYLAVDTKAGKSQVGIERLHLEEDTGKLIHEQGNSLVDFNRAGTPLMEIVTKPTIASPAEAKAFLQELRLIVRYLGVSDADMEKGHLRCDVNISLRPVGESKLYPKTEVKNLNSFRAVERALAYEIERQEKLWKKGTPPKVPSTRGWKQEGSPLFVVRAHDALHTTYTTREEVGVTALRDEKKGETVEQREKEAVHDYRYFPEPDIPPLELSQEQIEAWRAELPELPAARRKHYREEWGLPPKVTEFLLENQVVGNFTERMVDAIIPAFEGDAKAAAKVATNWIVNKYITTLDETKRSFESEPISPSQFGDFLQIVVGGGVNSTNAQVLLRRMVETGRDPEEILLAEDLAQGGGEDLSQVVVRVLAAYPEQAEQLKNGKEALLKFFVGAVMKETKGKVDPVEVEERLREAIK